jgi:hypothetical protein
MGINLLYKGGRVVSKAFRKILLGEFLSSLGAFALVRSS